MNTKRTTSSVRTRPLLKDEVDRLIVLWKEFMKDPASLALPIPTHRDDTRRMKESVASLLGGDPRQVLVAEVDGRLVGFMIFERHRKTALRLP